MNRENRLVRMHFSLCITCPEVYTLLIHWKKKSPEVQGSSGRSSTVIRPYQSNSNGTFNQRPYHHVKITYDRYKSNRHRYEASTSPPNNTSPVKAEKDEPHTIVYFDNRPIHCHIRSVDELFALQYFQIADMFAYIVEDQFYKPHLVREIINVYRLRLLDTHNFRQACGYQTIFPCPNITPTAFNEYLKKLGNCPGQPRCYNLELRMNCQDQAFNAQGESYILNPLDLRKIPPAVIHTLRFIGNIVFGAPFHCTTNLDAFACYHAKEEHGHEEGQQSSRPVSSDAPQINGNSNKFEDMLRRSAEQIQSPQRSVLGTVPPPLVNCDYDVHP